MVRASALGAVGRGFAPWPRHTKGGKKGTGSSLADAHNKRVVRNDITTLALNRHGSESILFFSMWQGKVIHFPVIIANTHMCLLYGICIVLNSVPLSLDLTVHDRRP